MAEKAAKLKTKQPSRTAAPTKPAAKAKGPAKASAKAGAKARPRANDQGTGESASQLIDQRIRDLGGWRGQTLARMRGLIREADPQIVEEWKWRNPVWSRGGIVCTGEAYKQVVKLTFVKGASLPDPSHLFNSSLEGNTRRAIDIPEGAEVDAAAFQALIRAAVKQNGQSAK